jgi:hypothetical protein
MLVTLQSQKKSKPFTEEEFGDLNIHYDVFEDNAASSNEYDAVSSRRLF